MFQPLSQRINPVVGSNRYPKGLTRLIAVPSLCALTHCCCDELGDSPAKMGYPQNKLELSSLGPRARMEDPTESPTRGQCRRALGASKQLWGFSWSHPRPLVTRMRNRLNITSQHSQHNARHRWLDFPGSPPPGTNSQRHRASVCMCVCVCVCVRAHSRQPNSKSAVDNTGGSLVLRITHHL